MNVCTHFPKSSLTKKAQFAYGVGEEQREVLIDKVIVDYIEEHCSPLLNPKRTIELILLENVHFIEHARQKTQKKDALEDYVVNAISASLMNVTPVSYDANQVVDVKFDNLVFQCGKLVSKTIKIPQFILCMMREQDVIQIVEDEVINIEAKNFDFALFVDYIRGVLFSTLFEHKVEADNWVH
ncbi:hypothetical protein AB6D66_26565 [Vibrio pomeroyi]|uniref:Uncharacterized protein n=1 Tax=Vibrio pomeroyi TaxID=198832 RepID=A0ABV4N575_9VIBR|nr:MULTISPECIES: hypothetical protein [unclassified Vibrio]UPR55761.1 hypothetical protein ITG10_11365 [Vibrio sp. ED004]